MKNLTSVHKSSEKHWVGNGFPVISVLSYMDHGRQLNPFILLDYAEPMQFPGDGKRRGVEAHPHRGFETVTLAYQGEVEHRDSSGGGGKIGPGDVQWMTAGAGIVHEEFHSTDFSRKGGMFEMAQLWVNLPAAHKNAKAGYQTLLKNQILDVQIPGTTGRLRVVAGEYLGHKGPAKTFTPINLWDVNLPAGSTAELPVLDGHVTALLIMRGELTVADKKLTAGDLAIFDRAGAGITLSALTDCAILVMSGAPIDEPLAGHGPFVMNTQVEIEQAFQDFRSGSMGKIGS